MSVPLSVVVFLPLAGGLAVGAMLSIAGILVAYNMFVRSPGVTLWLRDRYRAVHDFLEHKWYFDELYDALFVRPSAAFGRFGQSVVETRFVQDVVIGGATGTVRAATGVARGIQSGYLRAYAMLLIVGLSGLGLYFLIQSS